MTKLICLAVGCLLLVGSGVGCNKTIREAKAPDISSLRSEI
jgi:hypothetical protein